MDILKQGLHAWLNPKRRVSATGKRIDTALVAVCACLIVVTFLLWA